jgi:dTDP-4-amino-4,6-dideoxygalactose transaminase
MLVDGREEQIPEYKKIFDYVINLQKINIENYDTILKGLLSEKKDWLASLDLQAEIETPGMDWMMHGRNIDIREIKSRLNESLTLYESLLNRFPGRAGDEVITSAYTYTASASPAVHVGAALKFIDVAPDSFEMDYDALEAAITEKTKVIVPVHYAGVSCDMDKIMEIAKRHNLIVIEDAAQGIMSTYHGKALGTIGDYGCYSFHETKNYSMGEGGAILIKDKDKAEEAEILREKGTNRSKFFRGEIDKYTWVDYGSSYLPSDMNAAYLYAQLLQADMINNYRLNLKHYYNVQIDYEKYFEIKDEKRQME